MSTPIITRGVLPLRPPTSVLAPRPLSVQGIGYNEFDDHFGLSAITLTNNLVLTEQINVAGSGVIQFLGWTGDASIVTSQLKVTVDGVVVYDESNAALSASTMQLVFGAVAARDTDNVSSLSFEQAAFNSEFKVETLQSGNCNLVYHYYET